MTVSGQFSCPPPGSLVAVSGQFLVSAITRWATKLGELSGLASPEGRDVNVIDKQIRAEVGLGSTVFEIEIRSVGLRLALGVAVASGSKYGSSCDRRK